MVDDLRRCEGVVRCDVAGSVRPHHVGPRAPDLDAIAKNTVEKRLGNNQLIPGIGQASAAKLAEAGFRVLVPEGTYFVTADIRPLGYQDGVEFCRTLPDRVGVVAIPTAIFYDHPEAARSHVRFAF